MHGASSQTRLVDVDYPQLPMDLGVSETTGSADAQFVPPAEKPSDSIPHMPSDGIIGLACEAEPEVLGPARHKSVEPGPQLGPGCRVPAVKQGIDLFLEPFPGLLRWLGRNEPLTGPPMPRRSEGIAQEVERLFSGVTETRLARVDRQAELLQPPRDLRQAFFRLAPARTEDDKVIGVGDDLSQPLTRPGFPPVTQKAVDVDIGQQR